MSRRDTAVFVGAIALIIVLALLSSSSAASDPADLRPSSYVTSPGGAAALYQVLDELGIRVARQLDPFTEESAPAGALAILAPSEAPSPDEIRAILQWIEQGGTLLYAAGARDVIADSLGLRRVSLAPRSLSALRATQGSTAHPLPHATTRDVGEVAGFRRAFEGPYGPGAEPLLEVENSRVVALRVPRGRGQIFAFSDAAPLVNDRIEGAGAALLFARAAALGGGEVTFDEYHHGFRSGGSPIALLQRFLFRTDPGRAVLQLVGASLALLLLLGTRFGAPLPAPPAERRDPLEHVGALASAYRRAGATRTARTLLLNGLIRRLGKLHAGAHPDAVFDLLRRSSTGSASEAAAGLESEWRKDEAADLVVVARHIDEILADKR